MQTQNAQMVKFTSNLYADGWRVVKVWKTDEIRVCQTNGQPMTRMFFNILVSSWIVSRSQSVKYWYKVCAESQLTVLKRCMAMQAAFLWKISLLFLPCGYSLFYHLWYFSKNKEGVGVGVVLIQGTDFPLKKIANPEIPGKKELIPNSRRIWTANWSKIVKIHIQLYFYWPSYIPWP